MAKYEQGLAFIRQLKKSLPLDELEQILEVADRAQMTIDDANAQMAGFLPAMNDWKAKIASLAAEYSEKKHAMDAAHATRMKAKESEYAALCDKILHKQNAFENWKGTLDQAEGAYHERVAALSLQIEALTAEKLVEEKALAKLKDAHAAFKASLLN